MTYVLKERSIPEVLLVEAPARAQPRRSLPAALLGDDPAAYSYLLLVRFALINMIGFALAAAFVLAGWAKDVVLGDSTRLTVVIVAVFVGGLALCAFKVWRTSQELNAVRTGAAPASKVGYYLSAVAHADAGSRALIAGSLRLKLTARITVIRQIASTLVLLGLIGTVIGFIIALSGVDPAAGADTSAVAPMIAGLVDGMAVALNTTLVGSVLNVWLAANYQLLATGTANLIAAVVALGEARARS
ncbi:MAG: MotA/TolQ/ExbB proton channel family protein [Alphaproteobacteria bacterium]